MLRIGNDVTWDKGARRWSRKRTRMFSKKRLCESKVKYMGDVRCGRSKGEVSASEALNSSVNGGVI